MCTIKLIYGYITQSTQSIRYRNTEKIYSVDDQLAQNHEIKGKENLDLASLVSLVFIIHKRSSRHKTTSSLVPTSNIGIDHMYQFSVDRFFNRSDQDINHFTLPLSVALSPNRSCTKGISRRRSMLNSNRERKHIRRKLERHKLMQTHDCLIYIVEHIILTVSYHT